MKKILIAPFLLLPLHKVENQRVVLIVNSIENCNCRMVFMVGDKFTGKVFKLKPKAKLDTFRLQVKEGFTGLSIDCNNKSENFPFSKTGVDTLIVDFSKNGCP